MTAEREMMKLKSQTIDLGLSGYDELFMTE